ncbi:cordon-bleu protein-like 1 isoform X2 [Acanthaster planci]|uniref:Cordon-bleu protein-like 1 isoform X2 n=1 Tax=Acanthaster planci TaxID=133434 RepID=A0A8B7Z6X4_ACAPL|nr:cordon-bleu protein-like 1 isoform X2 [Acanthaster planci]
MSVETTKIPNHQPSKRSRAPPPPTKKPSFEENKNGSLSELEKDALTKNGSTEETAGTSSGDERQLTVVLPEDKIVKASVKRDTPILELLIMIASKNKLNPTNYTIAQPGVRLKDPLVQLKPTQKLSDVVGDTIHIIRKNQKQVFVYKKEEKKSAVIEPTIRITVISSKNHKMCLRVDPTKTLQELMPTICDERGVELSNHTLRLTTQPQDPLEMSQTLEKSGAIEFLLVDLNGQPAGVEGGEADLMPEQKKKKGSFFGKLSKKKKGYELGAGGIPESQPTNVMPPVEKEKRSHRHTSPSSLPPSEGLTQTTGQEDEGSNTLKKRRPAPPPPPGKHVTTSTSASDDEKLDEDSSLASNNTLRKRRAPAPPRPTSPPRRSVSLGETSPHQIPVNLPPPRPVSPPIRASDAKEMKQISNSQETSTSVKGDKPSRPPKPPRPVSLIRGTSLESPSPTTEPQEPVFVPPPPPDMPPSPSNPQEDVTKLIEEGRLNQSFDENLMDEEYREESPRVHSESISSSLTETGIDEAFEAAIAMGEAEIEAKKEEVAEDSPHQHETDLEVNVAGLILETKAEGTEEGMDQESAQEEGAKSQEMKETDEVSSGEIEQTALPAPNSSHANCNNEHGDGALITHINETIPATHLKKLRQKGPVKVYAVYDETTSTTKAGHSILVENGDVTRSRSKSDTSALEVPTRVRSERSLSVLEKAKPLEGMKLSFMPESIDIVETPSVAMATVHVCTSSEITSCPSTRVNTSNQSMAISQSHETSDNDVSFAEDLLRERKVNSTADNHSIFIPGFTAKDSKAKMELLSHMMKMSLDADTQDTDDYPPHTQADDTHDMFEEKSVHALAFEVTRESAEDSEGNAGESIEDQDEKVEEKERKDATKMEESYNKVEDENTDETEEESVQEVVKEKEEMKADERPKKDEKGKLTSSEAPADTTVQKLNEQYSALQEQLAALQKQMVIPQQPGIMEIQMQQLQQQILLQQQIISQMMMSSNQQPMVMPLAFQQPGISPQQQMMLSPQQMMSPPQQMMISPQQQIMSQQMLSPQQQIMMSPQQLMMTPPMFSAVHSVPHNTAQPNVYTQQVMPTATVQAQSTPISSTHELNESTVSTTQDVALQINDDDSLSKNDESPSKSDLVSIKDDSPSSDDVITSEHTSDIKDDHEPQPLSPPMKADEVSVCHPTYHFARSRDVPKNEITGVKASPPSTLRSPQHQQRPPLFKSPESNEKKEVTETETKESPAAGNKEPTGTLGRRLTVDDHNIPPEERHMGDKADVSETEDKHVEDKADVSETEDKHMSGEKSSISAFAVANSEASKPASSSVPKSPKQKKSGFSLFKKKTPKYSYILSAQKEFSRKSETERQRTSSNPPEPTNKSESDQGSRGRAHTLDSYDPTRETHSLTFHLVRGGSQREMGDNVLISSKVPTYTTNEMHLNTDEQPVIPPRTSKPKTSNVKVSQANSSPQDGTTGALILSNQSPISVVTNTTLTTVTTCSSAPTVKKIFNNKAFSWN